MQEENQKLNLKSVPIHVIGTDACGLENLPYCIQEIILSTSKLAASKRILETIPEWWESKKGNEAIPELFLINNPSELILWLKEQNTKTIVLASGDPLWYGIGRCLSDALPKNRLVFHPSPSSFQLAFARLGLSWQDSSWISLHGRSPDSLAKKLQKRPKALTILTDPSRGGAKEVKAYLQSSGLEQSYAFWIFERLGHPKERIRCLLPNDDLSDDIHPLHLVLLIEKEDSFIDSKRLPLFGISDGIFLQHRDCPGLMTKRETRIQIIADLELPETGVIWDVGAGVGSIGLEAIRLRPKLKLLSIEKRVGAEILISKNAKRLSVKPTSIIESEALEILTTMDIHQDLKKPNRIILGGGGSNKNIILEKLLKILQPAGIIVIPVITLESIASQSSILKASGCKVKIQKNQHWRGVSLSDGTRLNPMNPVFILQGKMP